MLLYNNNNNNIMILLRIYYVMFQLFVIIFLTTTSWSSSSSSSSSSVVKALASPQQPPLLKTKTKTKTNIAEHIPLAKKAIEYLDASTDPFHAVQTSINLLEQVGFTELDNTNNDMIIQPGGKYYYTRNKSTLVAFAVGGKYDASSSNKCGCKIIGGHTDSPNLRIKPRSKRIAAGCIQLGVECYGGGLWHTWFDRDLGISGRVFIRDTGNENNDINRSTIQQRLIKIDKALLRISNLAIHLQTADERKAFHINKEDHLSPILALEVKKALEGNTEEEEEKSTTTNTNTNTNRSTKDGWVEYQEPALLQLLANELNVNIDNIIDFELSLFDIQKATLGGVFNEFIHSARLDNLASCFMAVQALIHHVQQSNLLDNDTDINMIVLYDHEEVGSTSAVGAASPILQEAIQIISSSSSNNNNNNNNNPTIAYQNCIRNSFVISSDQAHAIHPNYISKHEKYHQPKMNPGMVIKRNCNQRYATTPVTGVIMKEIARRANLQQPLQEFIVRQDCGCGSTIGPIISAATGIRTIDMGCPQLSMHSIRETMGICDITNGVDLFKAFFQHFRSVDTSLEQ